MKLYKHYFDKDDTPFAETYQPKKKYHTAWKRGPYVIFLLHKVVKIKFLGIFTIYRLNPKDREKLNAEIAERKRKLNAHIAGGCPSCGHKPGIEEGD